MDTTQHPPDFRHTQHDWQLFLLGWTQKLEGLPLPFQRPFKEKLDPAQGDCAGGAGCVFFILEEEEILAQFFFIDLIRCFVIVLRQLTHGQQIRLLGPLCKPMQLHIVQHLLS